MGAPVIVIGAGGAGLAVGRALVERGIPCTLLERREALGGMWRMDDGDGRSEAYASLRANVSKWRTAYPGVPFPRGTSTFPTREEMTRYLERFADRYGLRAVLRTRAEVAAVRRAGDAWEVELADGERLPARAVVVATGFTGHRRVPELPGSFDGLQLHAGAYREPSPFAGKDVVVVGLGCSATELSVEIAEVARSTVIATRSGSWIVRRRVGGVPFDLVDTRLNSRLRSWPVRRAYIRALVRVVWGRPERLGLPRPTDRPGDRPFAVSDGLFAALRAGRVRVVPAPRELRGDRVLLADGREHRADAILWGTGYEPAHPFLPEDATHPTAGHVPLYRGVVDPAAPGLFHVGLALGHGALIPMYDAQARWVAEVLAGRLVLPSPEVMRTSIAADRRVRHRDFGPRLDVLFDRLRYVDALTSEARRARRRPGPSPHAAAATVA